jgi:hypothetical protein
MNWFKRTTYPDRRCYTERGKGWGCKKDLTFIYWVFLVVSRCWYAWKTQEFYQMWGSREEFERRNRWAGLPLGWVPK